LPVIDYYRFSLNKESARGDGLMYFPFYSFSYQPRNERGVDEEGEEGR
jgi:hypothetical protein